MTYPDLLLHRRIHAEQDQVSSGASFLLWCLGALYLATDDEDAGAQFSMLLEARCKQEGVDPAGLIEKLGAVRP